MRKHTLKVAAVAAVAAAASISLSVPVASAHPTNKGNSGQGYRQTVVIAHRGASGYRPEHTIAAYELAIKQCADYIEPDLVMTKDKVLVDRHENDITGTTDVSTRPEFAARRATKTIDGTKITGWFTEDFTLAELKSLRAKERLPQLRPGSATYDGRFQVPTFEEDLTLAKKSRSCKGKPMGIIPEIKHGSYFDSIGLSMEEEVVRLLHKYGYRDKRDPAVIQSFEVGNLVELNRRTNVKLAQLIDCSGGPADKPGTLYTSMTTRQGLKKIARYADQVGLCKNVMIPANADGTLGKPTSVIKDAHRAHLTVVGWTFRAENSFLPTEFRSSSDPAAHGNLVGEIQAFLNAGMDQLFTDHPDLGVLAVRTR